MNRFRAEQSEQIQTREVTFTAQRLTRKVTYCSLIRPYRNLTIQCRSESQPNRIEL